MGLNNEAVAWGIDNCYIAFSDESTTVSYPYPKLEVSHDEVVDIGRETYAFNDIWGTAQVPADFYFLDDRDDLAELHKIKGSGVIDKRTGLVLIDDDSLPIWLLTKAAGDVRERGSEYIQFKKGDVVYNQAGKPYIALKTAISHLWGCVKQLDNKVESIING